MCAGMNEFSRMNVWLDYSLIPVFSLAITFMCRKDILLSSMSLPVKGNGSL
jgi:hypothetical protein